MADDIRRDGVLEMGVPIAVTRSGGQGAVGVVLDGTPTRVDKAVAARLVAAGLQVVMYCPSHRVAVPLLKRAPSTLLVRPTQSQSPFSGRLTTPASYFTIGSPRLLAYPQARTPRHVLELLLELRPPSLHVVVAVAGARLTAAVDLLLESPLLLTQGTTLLSCGAAPEATVAVAAGRCRRCGVHFVQAAVDTHYPLPVRGGGDSDSDSDSDSASHQHQHQLEEDAQADVTAEEETTDDETDDDHSTAAHGLFVFVAATAAAVNAAMPLLKSLATEHHAVLGADPCTAADLHTARRTYARNVQLRTLHAPRVKGGVRIPAAATTTTEEGARRRHAKRLATATQQAEQDGRVQVCVCVCVREREREPVLFYLLAEAVGRERRSSLGDFSPARHQRAGGGAESESSGGGGAGDDRGRGRRGGGDVGRGSNGDGEERRAGTCATRGGRGERAASERRHAGAAAGAGTSRCGGGASGRRPRAGGGGGGDGYGASAGGAEGGSGGACVVALGGRTPCGGSRGGDDGGGGEGGGGARAPYTGTRRTVVPGWGATGGGGAAERELASELRARAGGLLGGQ